MNENLFKKINDTIKQKNTTFENLKKRYIKELTDIYSIIQNSFPKIKFEKKGIVYEKSKIPKNIIIKILSFEIEDRKQKLHILEREIFNLKFSFHGFNIIKTDI